MIERLFEEFAAAVRRGAHRMLVHRPLGLLSTVFGPTVHVWDGPDEIEVTAELSGIDESTIELWLERAAEHDVLHLHARRRVGGASSIPRGIDRVFAVVDRSIPLGSAVIASSVRATLTNGVLAIHLRRAPAKSAIPLLIRSASAPVSPPGRHRTRYPNPSRRADRVNLRQ